VKFLVDAQLPARFARFLNDAGHEAVHTSDLPDGNRSSDSWIAQFADGVAQQVRPGLGRLAIAVDERDESLRQSAAR